MTSLASANAAVLAATDTALTLADYTGGQDDLGYLRQYVLDHVTDVYGVEAQIFDTATVMSTTILRDFLHRATREYEVTRTYSSLDGVPPVSEDVAFLLRHMATESCGPTALQLANIFHAFGYEAIWLDSVASTAAEAAGT